MQIVKCFSFLTTPVFLYFLLPMNFLSVCSPPNQWMTISQDRIFFCTSDYSVFCDNTSTRQSLSSLHPPPGLKQKFGWGREGGARRWRRGGMSWRRRNRRRRIRSWEKEKRGIGVCCEGKLWGDYFPASSQVTRSKLYWHHVACLLPSCPVHQPD